MVGLTMCLWCASAISSGAVAADVLQEHGTLVQITDPSRGRCPGLHPTRVKCPPPCPRVGAQV